MSKALQSKPIGTVEAPTFTVGMARNGFGDADRVRETADLIREEKGNVDRIAGHVMWNAALHAYDVLEVRKSEFLGKDGVWTDQTDYVLRGLGFKSKGYATTLKRLGRAAVVHGVTRGSAEWAFLASTAQLAPVGKAIALDDTEEFRRLIKGYAAEMKAGGKISADARTPQLPTGEGEDSGETDTQNRGGSATVAGEVSERRDATLQDVLDAVDDFAKGADRETWAAMENRLTRIITRENTVRAAKAAKGE